MLTALKVYIFTLKRNMDLLLDASWKEELKEEFMKPYFTELSKKVEQEYEQYTCYPDRASSLMLLTCALLVRLR